MDGFTAMRTARCRPWVPHFLYFFIFFIFNDCTRVRIPLTNTREYEYQAWLAKYQARIRTLNTTPEYQVCTPCKNIRTLKYSTTLSFDVKRLGRECWQYPIWRGGSEQDSFASGQTHLRLFLLVRLEHYNRSSRFAFRLFEARCTHFSDGRFFRFSSASPLLEIFFSFLRKHLV